MLKKITFIGSFVTIAMIVSMMEENMANVNAAELMTCALQGQVDSVGSPLTDETVYLYFRISDTKRLLKATTVSDGVNGYYCFNVSLPNDCYDVVIRPGTGNESGTKDVELDAPPVEILNINLGTLSNGSCLVED